MESTIALCKSELIDFEAGTWTDWGEVERATVGWVHRYNHERLHSSLGHIPPIERYTNYQRENYAGLHAALKNSGRFRAKAFDANEGWRDRRWRFVFATAQTGSIPDPCGLTGSSKRAHSDAGHGEMSSHTFRHYASRRL